MKWKSFALECALIFFAAVFLAQPARYIPVCFDGIALWAECVLPSLFPFMVITLIAVKSGIAQTAAKPFTRATSAFNLPPVGAVIFLMSICSGYPAGSRIICEFRESGAISDGDCRKLAALCTTSGPLFIVGSVGYKMFSDNTVGIKLLCAHILSVFAVGAIYCLAGKREKVSNALYKRTDTNILYDSFYSAVISVIVAGGFICFFYTLSVVISDYKLLFPLQYVLTYALGEAGATAVCKGVIEATGGCAALGAGGCPLALPLAGFLVTFGGFSILMQQLCYLVKCGVKPLFFILIKFVQGTLCFLLLLITA